MADLNSVALTGRIAAEPELIERGTLRVARLRLRVEAVRRDRRTGELEPRQHLLDVAVFGGPAEEAARLRVGTHVAVRGQLSFSTRTGSDGSMREAVGVTTADWVRPLGGAEGAGPEPEPASTTGSGRPHRGPGPSALSW